MKLLASEIDTYGLSIDRRRKLTQLKQQLIDNWKKEIEDKWEHMKMDAAANIKDPSKFWNKTKRLIGNNTKKSTYIRADDGTKIYDPEEQEIIFQHKWKSVYRISPEENRQFCIEPENEVKQYMIDNSDRWRHFDTIDFSRLDPGNELIRPITI